MDTKNSMRKHCVICNKYTGVLVCNGCQLTYCGKHVRKHRQELSYKLENLIEEHDIIEEDIEQLSNEHYHLRRIDKWEKQSIKKIQIAADFARKDLKQIVEKSKRRLLKISRDIASDLHLSWKTEDFSENELNKWMKQLNDLRLDIKSAYGIHFIDDQQFPIYPITVTTNSIEKISNAKKIRSYECFTKTSNSIVIENDGLIVRHTGPDFDYAHILGKQYYSQGRHTIRFELINSSQPYTIFFGCISSNMIQKTINFKSSCVVGWFGYNEIYQHGIWNNNVKQHGYDSNQIQTDDILHLTLDCDQRYIELFHERLKQTYKIAVNLEKAPFPWQFLVVLVHQDDCVKILPKS